MFKDKDWDLWNSRWKLSEGISPPCLDRFMKLWDSTLQRISQNQEVKILNSKGEYNRCKLPRLQVADEFKDPKEHGGGRVKYTLPNKQLKANPNDDKKIRERSDKLKANDSSIDYGSQVNSQSSINLIDFQVDNSSKAALQTESKPNMVVQGEVKNQSRRQYKFVANNYRFRKKFDMKKLSDNIDISN